MAEVTAAEFELLDDGCDAGDTDVPDWMRRSYAKLKSEESMNHNQEACGALIPDWQRRVKAAQGVVPFQRGLELGAPKKGPAPPVKPPPRHLLLSGPYPAHADLPAPTHAPTSGSSAPARGLVLVAPRPKTWPKKTPEVKAGLQPSVSPLHFPKPPPPPLTTGCIKPTRTPLARAAAFHHPVLPPPAPLVAKVHGMGAPQTQPKLLAAPKPAGQVVRAQLQLLVPPGRVAKPPKMLAMPDDAHPQLPLAPPPPQFLGVAEARAPQFAPAPPRPPRPPPPPAPRAPRALPPPARLPPAPPVATGSGSHEVPPGRTILAKARPVRRLAAAAPAATAIRPPRDPDAADSEPDPVAAAKRPRLVRRTIAKMPASTHLTPPAPGAYDEDDDGVPVPPQPEGSDAGRGLKRRTAGDANLKMRAAPKARLLGLALAGIASNPPVWRSMRGSISQDIPQAAAEESAGSSGRVLVAKSAGKHSLVPKSALHQSRKFLEKPMKSRLHGSVLQDPSVAPAQRQTETDWAGEDAAAATAAAPMPLQAKAQPARPGSAAEAAPKPLESKGGVWSLWSRPKGSAAQAPGKGDEKLAEGDMHDPSSSSSRMCNLAGDWRDTRGSIYTVWLDQRHAKSCSVRTWRPSGEVRESSALIREIGADLVFGKDFALVSPDAWAPAPWNELRWEARSGQFYQWMRVGVAAGGSAAREVHKAFSAAKREDKTQAGVDLRQGVWEEGVPGLEAEQALEPEADADEEVALATGDGVVEEDTTFEEGKLGRIPSLQAVSPRSKSLPPSTLAGQD